MTYRNVRKRYGLAIWEDPGLGTFTMHPDRLFPPDPAVRAIARRLYASVSNLPIISPHGHTDPRWFATDANFSDPAALFVTPDHYVFRMLYSQGVPLERLGIKRRDGERVEDDPRKIWRVFAEHFHLFRGTPTRMWLEQSLHDTFGVRERLAPESADRIYDRVSDHLARPEFRPRALFDRFGIEVIATTDSALDDLRHHDAIELSGWSGRVVPTYRPDAVVDPSRREFSADVEAFVAMAGAPMNWAGYLEAHRSRRQYFKARGATVCVWGTRATREDYAGLEGSDLSGLAYAGVDVGDPDAIAAAAAPFDGLDVLILCQGTVVYNRGEFERKGWDHVMAVNLDSLMHICRRFRPDLAASRGSVVIVSSISGLKANRGNPAYAASKAGAISLTRTLGQAWAGEGIRVNGLAPGLVDTKLTKVTTEHPKRREGALAAIPSGRLGTPADMAGAALFLASPLAAYVNGHTLVVDGGLSL